MARGAWKAPNAGSPCVYGHRGASAAKPENTIEAFLTARAMGADGVELDARRTADGRLAVLHDARLADGRLLVELARADVPREVPDLGAALDACAGMAVNIEIKNNPPDPDYDPDELVARRVVAMLAERAGTGMNDRILISSFNPLTLAAVQAEDRTLATAQLTADLSLHGGPAAAIEAAAASGHVALHPWDGTVDAELVDRAHVAGLAVNVWTVDGRERLAELADLGVDGVCTNVPDVALDVFGRSNARLPVDRTARDTPGEGR